MAGAATFRTAINEEKSIESTGSETTINDPNLGVFIVELVGMRTVSENVAATHAS